MIIKRKGGFPDLIFFQLNMINRSFEIIFTDSLIPNLHFLYVLNLKGLIQIENRNDNILDDQG